MDAKKKKRGDKTENAQRGKRETSGAQRVREAPCCYVLKKKDKGRKHKHLARLGREQEVQTIHGRQETHTDKRIQNLHPTVKSDVHISARHVEPFYKIEKFQKENKITLNNISSYKHSKQWSDPPPTPPRFFTFMFNLKRGTV